MILVDSSVWIEFLESPGSPPQRHLGELIRVPNLVSIPGPCVQEILQGIQDDEQFRLVRARLIEFPIVHADTDTYVVAARIYQAMAKAGVRVPPGDVTIAALAIQRSAPLYTLDQRHFERIRQRSSLRLHPGRSASPR